MFIQPKSTKNIFGGELQLKKESKITYSEMGKIPDKIQIEFKADHSYQIAFHIHAYFLFQLIKCLQIGDMAMYFILSTPIKNHMDIYGNKYKY